MTTAPAGMPSGRVTFVFTDIEGSTRLIRRLGERYVTLLDRHHALLRAVWAQHRGVEVKTEGDAFLVAFADQVDALAACAAAQVALQTEPWPADGQVRVRIGVHTGLASPHGNDYVALAVHQAARVVDTAHGGQTLVSADAAAGVTPPAGLALRSLGKFRVRDFDEPLELLQLDVPGLEVGFPAPRVLPADRHNITRPLTDLVGRQDELGVLTHLVVAGRAVSIVGPGGVGKTRLAVEHALGAVDRWPDGVWMVHLAPVGDGLLAANALASALGRHAAPGTDLVDDLAAYLSTRSALLVFDNAEHIRQPVALLASLLLQRCPLIGILTTSREPLGVRGEVVSRLGPLDADQRDASDQPAAVQLFIQRSTESGGQPSPSDDQLRQIAVLCRRLDGLPLAIEMAAARTSVFSPAEIMAGLDDRTRHLGSGDPTLAERHRSLDNLLEWSEVLLSPEERTLFDRLGIFASGFGHETAAAAVGDDLPDSGMIPDLLWGLANKSLITAEPAAGGTRYRLLETVRSFVRRRREPDDAALDAARMAGWYLDRLGPDRALDRRWVSAMADEIDNVRALVLVLAERDGATAQRLAWSIGQYLDLVQDYASGIDEVARTVRLLQQPTPERVGLLALLAYLHLRVGDLAPATALLGEAAGLQLEVGPAPWDAVGVERAEGEVALREGAFERAMTIAASSLAQPLSLRGQGRMWNLMGIARYSAGDSNGAATAFEHELAAWQGLGVEALVVSAHGNLAEALVGGGNRAGAARHQLACLELALQYGQPLMVSYSLMFAAHQAAVDDRWDAAVRLQTVADTELAAIGAAMYEEDRTAADNLLADARRALGDEAYENLRAAAQNIGLTDTLDETQALLAEIGRDDKEHAP